MSVSLQEHSKTLALRQEIAQCGEEKTEAPRDWGILGEKTVNIISDHVGSLGHCREFEYLYKIMKSHMGPCN